MLAAFFVSAPVLALLLALGVALAAHPYAARIGWRYLRSKKRRTVSVITFIAVSGVALGVGALLAVMSITSGFQETFRDKVLGVNSHVLVLKYGLDFENYNEVIEQAREMPEVAGAAPFVINEMMLTRGDRIAGVLVKGVDPERMPTVLDLPSQLTQGNLTGMRRPGASPPLRPDDLLRSPSATEDEDLDQLLRRYADEFDARRAGDPAPDVALPEIELPDEDPDLDALGDDDGFIQMDVLPEVEVPSVDQVHESLDEGEVELPDDAIEDQLFLEEELLFEGEGEEALEDLPGIVLGFGLAENLGVGVGHRVKVTSPLAGLDLSMVGGGESQAPRSRDFRVIGIFQAGFQEYDTRLVYVDIFEAQRFFDHGDSVTGVEIRLHDLEEAPVVARRLERMLGPPFHTMDWQELNRNLFTALEVQKIALSVVIATIIFVAAFNVIATLIMVVLEKKREIAILKAMGARSFGVLLVFMVQGLLIGLVGTTIGLALGGGVCFYFERYRFPLDPHVYLIDHLPVRTSLSEFVITISTALFICIIATVIPSFWAARALPADGVRYE